MPNRDAVRSLSFPARGLPSIATTAPAPVTRDSAFGASSVPTSELIFSARVTSNGAMSTKVVLMNARA